MTPGVSIRRYQQQQEYETDFALIRKMFALIQATDNPIA
jgi:hypothetical protein